MIDDVISEYNGLGYSGTNSGGDLYIVNSTFRQQPGRHRAQLAAPTSSATPSARPPSSATSCTTTTTWTNPAIDVALLAQGNGILAGRGGPQHHRARTSSTTTTGPASAWCRSPRRTPTTSRLAESAWDHPLRGDPRRAGVPTIPSAQCTEVALMGEGLRRDLEPQARTGGGQRRLRVQGGRPRRRHGRPDRQRRDHRVRSGTASRATRSPRRRRPSWRRWRPATASPRPPTGTHRRST